MDADLGVVVTGLTDAVAPVLRHGAPPPRAAPRAACSASSSARPRPRTGAALEVAANVGSAADVAEAVAGGADGVGLFRTEMLFLARTDAAVRGGAVRRVPPRGRRRRRPAGHRPDARRRRRQAASLPRAAEGGQPVPRATAAVRIYPEFEALFRTQVRALVRASAFGRLQVMIPMVSRLDEVAWVRRVVADEQAALAAAGGRLRPPDAGRRHDRGAVGRVHDRTAQPACSTSSASARTTCCSTSSPSTGRTRGWRRSPNPLEPSFIRLLAPGRLRRARRTGAGSGCAARWADRRGACRSWSASASTRSAWPRRTSPSTKALLGRPVGLRRARRWSSGRWRRPRRARWSSFSTSEATGGRCR